MSLCLANQVSTVAFYDSAANCCVHRRLPTATPPLLYLVKKNVLIATRRETTLCVEHDRPPVPGSGLDIKSCVVGYCVASSIPEPNSLLLGSLAAVGMLLGGLILKRGGCHLL